MKKTILLGLGLLMSLCLNAQKAGQNTFGFSVGGSYIDHNMDIALSEFYISSETAGGVAATAEFSKFLTDDFRLSFSAVYGLQIPDNATIARIHALAIGPSFAFYAKLADGLYLAPEMGGYVTLGWYRTKYNSRYPDIPSTVSSVPVGFILAANLLSFEYKPSEKLGICFSAGSLQVAWSRSEGSDKVNTNVEMSLNAASSVGLRFYF